MKRSFYPLLYALLAVFMVACTTSDPIAMVTPLAEKSESEEDRGLLAVKAEPDVVMESVEIKSTQVVVTSMPVDSTFGLATPTHSVPTPAFDELPRGQALAEAYAEDIEWEFEPPNPVDLPDGSVPIQFDEFFISYDPWSYEPPELSDKLIALDGEQVVMEGYMSPPLKLGLDWFMLTRVPVASCAFCSGAADWTPDMILIYVNGEEYPYTYNPLRLEGELHIGPLIDAETGMVSLIRMYVDHNGIEEMTQ